MAIRGRWSLPMSCEMLKSESLAARFGEQMMRSRISGMDVAQWMWVGSSLLIMVRSVLLMNSFSVVPDLFVVLQLKSVCFALKSPIRMVCVSLLRRVKSLTEGGVPGGQYMVAIVIVVCMLMGILAAMYSLF